MARDVARLAERMHMHAVGHLACHPQHPRVHRRDVDLRIRRVDRARAPLRRDEVQAVKVPVVLQLPRPERTEARLHRPHVIPQPRTRPLEFHPVSPHHMRAYLGAKAEPELAARCLL